MQNSSNSLENSTPDNLGLTSQDRQLISILDSLQSVSVTGPSNNTDSTRLTVYIGFETAFNLNNRAALSDEDIKVLEKELDYVPIQNKINEPELRNDFNEFCRRMRLKWYFRNEVTPNFSEVPAFRPKSSWNPPKGHPNLEVFLSEVEKELFTVVDSKLGYSNLYKEEWKSMRTLADDRTTVIKKADKGSCVVVWDRNDYIKEAEKQLNDTNVYTDVCFNEKLLQELVGTSNKLFQNLKAKGKISDKQLKYFTYQYKKVTNLGKLYLLPKIHKRLANVPGRPVISNCGTPTEKASEFLDHHLKPVMQKGKSYIKDSGDFINKIKELQSIPNGAILVTSDVVALYPSIPHEAGLKALKNALDNRENKSISTEDLIKMARFVLQNNYFEFNGIVKQQISGTAIGTKFAPTYACIFMDKLETDFLNTQKYLLLGWYRYIDDTFFISTHGEEKLKFFPDDLNKYPPNINFTHESNKECINFLNLTVSLLDNKVSTDLYIKPIDRHQYVHYSSLHPDHTKKSTAYSQTFRVNRICSVETHFV